MAGSEIYETSFDEDAQTIPGSSPCPECNGRVRTNEIETVCKNCGLIIDEQRIDHGPEWSMYDDGGRKRTGAPLTVARHDRGLSTRIGRGTDANGKQLSGRKRLQLGRLRREHSRGRFQSKADRNLAHGLGEIRRISSSLSLAKTVRNQACQLFRTAQNEDLLKGRSIEAMAGASVYAACRCDGYSRTLEDIAKVARVEQSRVSTSYKTLNTELGLPTQPVTPSEFIPRVASELGVSNQIRFRAQQLAEKAESVGVTTGVRPSGFAAACLYKTANKDDHRLTQETVADAANVSRATVRTHRDTLDELDPV
ncbi:transcription initiation factor IIB [Halorussus sp. AFM4]|uniref:transcription initiation factor IIB n=1 Tax=Halorussus sp. AFM4 TaxID=3421651 RepID=UPI003EB782EB